MKFQEEAPNRWIAGLASLVGYGLLTLTLFDLVAIFVPPQFDNPAWELQLLGGLVESSPIPLMGLFLVFYGEHRLLLVRFFSGAALLAGVLFFLLIFPGVSATLRINSQNNVQIARQAEQQAEQVRQIEQALAGATTAEQIASLYSLVGQPLPTGGRSLDALKGQLRSSLPKLKQQARMQLEKAREEKRFALLKNAIKWNLGAFVAGFVFVGMGTGARRRVKSLQAVENDVGAVP